MPAETFFKTPGEYEGSNSKKGKKRKRIMRSFKIEEISSVDSPAQEHALMTIMKRAPVVETMEKVLILTSSEDGHQHMVSIDFDSLERGGGHTDFSSGMMASPDGRTHSPEHDHPFVINPDGTVTIGASNGHSHEVIMSEFMGRLRLQTALASSELETSVISVTHKNENGQEFLASDYALVLDATQPMTWKYPLVKSSGGEVHPRRVGSAVEAISKGRIPRNQLDTVIRRVRSAWKSCHKDHSEMPSVLKRVSF